jgi:undecaprenyl-diphosphatase
LPVCIAGFYSEILKELFFAPRPWLIFEDTHLMFEHGGMDSFPSGHSTIYAALATSAFFFSKRLGIFVGVFAVLIGLSRVISGVHWPIDVLGGLLIGTLISYSYHKLASEYFSLRNFKKSES